MFTRKIPLNVYDLDAVTEDGVRELVSYRKHLLNAMKKAGAPPFVLRSFVARLQLSKKQLMLKRQKDYDIGGEG